MDRFWWFIAAVMTAGLIFLVFGGSGQALNMADQDFGRLLYLGIFGAVVAAGAEVT